MIISKNPDSQNAQFSTFITIPEYTSDMICEEPETQIQQVIEPNEKTPSKTQVGQPVAQTRDINYK